MSTLRLLVRLFLCLFHRLFLRRYSDVYKKTSFKYTGTNGTYVYTDDVSFPSDGTTYYRCVPQGAAAVAAR